MLGQQHLMHQTDYWMAPEQIISPVIGQVASDMQGASAYQSAHGFLRTVKLYECHAARSAISMHHKVYSIRPHSVSSEEPADRHAPVIAT